MPKLVCTRGLNKGDEYQLRPGEEVILGRGEENGIVLYDRKSSRQHCRVVASKVRCTVEDLDSRNGTRVNGEKITKKTTIHPGGRIRIGSTVFHLSDKPPGNVLERSVTEAASEVRENEFDKQFNSTVKQLTKNSAKPAASDRAGLLGRLRNLFK